MHDLAEIGIIKWFISNVAVPLLGGLWGLLAWWIKMISDKFARLENKQAEDVKALFERVAESDKENSSTYARRDDLKEGLAHMREDMHTGFANVEKKLDTLMRHALKDAQG